MKGTAVNCRVIFSKQLVVSSTKLAYSLLHNSMTAWNDAESIRDAKTNQDFKGLLGNYVKTKLL